MAHAGTAWASGLAGGAIVRVASSRAGGDAATIVARLDPSITVHADATPAMPRTPRRTSAMLALLALLAGCERDEIRTYTAPADPPRTASATPNAATPDAAPAPGVPVAPGAARPVPPAPEGEATLDWTVPEGWRPAKNPPGFVLVAYDIGDEADRVQATVSRLAGAGGGAVANINRWRQQIGLPAVSSLPEQPMERIDTAGGDAAGLVDLVGEAGPSGQPARTLGAILPRQTGGASGGGETWFFKMTGPRDKVEPAKAAFVALVASVREKAGASKTEAPVKPASP